MKEFVVDFSANCCVRVQADDAEDAWNKIVDAFDCASFSLSGDTGMRGEISQDHIYGEAYEPSEPSGPVRMPVCPECGSDSIYPCDCDYEYDPSTGKWTVTEVNGGYECVECDHHTDELHFTGED